MADRLPSDHDSVETVRARVERHGGSRRLAIPREAVPDDESLVRVVLDERIRFGRLNEGTEDDRWLVGVFDTTRGASDHGSGQDRLDPWLDENDRSIGSSVEVDVIEPGRRYGLRVPGARTVYTGVERPDAGLDAIARRLADGADTGE